MEIIDNRADTHFRDIEIGECFEHCNTIYMRVYPGNDDQTGQFNAIQMEDAEPEYFEGDAEVIQVKVRLVRDR